MTDLLSELRLKIKAVADAYDLEYDGDEGKTARAQSNAGIELDDFVMVNGHELADLIAGKPATTPDGYVWQLIRRATPAEEAQFDAPHAPHHGDKHTDG